LKDELGALDVRHLLEAASAAGQLPSRYLSLRPAAAAMLLNADWRHSSKLSNTRLSTQLVTFARQHRVRVQFIRQISLLPTLDELPTMNNQSQVSCFRRLIDSITNERGRSGSQASAWAVGDIAALRSGYIAPANCTSVIAVDARRRGVAIAAWTAQIIQSLNKKHQQTFAMIDLMNLLGPDGVLAKLRQSGAAISTPED
jgi:hypothetical protein